MWVRFWSQEDPLEKKMATHSSFLAWRIAWTEEPGGLQSMGSQAVRQGWATEHESNRYTVLQIIVTAQKKNKGVKRHSEIGKYCFIRVEGRHSDKVTFVQNKRRELSHVDIQEKSFADRCYSMCKCPEMGAFPACSKSSKEVNMAQKQGRGW